MAISEFRSIELLDIGTLGGEALVNDSINNLARGVSGFLAIAIVGDVIELATDDDDLSLYAALRFTGAMTGDCTVIAPARARVYILDNATTGAFTLTFQLSGGASVILVQGTCVQYYADGSTLRAIGESSGVALPVASETVVGVSRFGTDSEDVAGLLRTVAVHPAGLKAALDARPGPPPASPTVVGVTRFATPAEGAAGVLNTVAMTPQTVQAKINAIPLASETVVGLVERATIPETIAGTDPTRYVSAAGLQAKIDTLPVAPITGTAYSVLRIPASGTGQQASPITVDASGAVIAKATNVQPVWTWQAEHTLTTGGLYLEAYQPGTGSPSFTFRKAKGTIVAPERETAVGGGSGNITGQVYARNATDTADAWVALGSMQFMIESVDAQGRMGGFWRVSTSPGVSAPVVEALRVTQAGNLLLGLTTHGTGLAKGLVLASGTAPTTSPVDAVQLWVADAAGAAGTASLHLRSEDGTQHVLGDKIGLGTSSPEPAYGATITGPLNVVPLVVVATSSSANNQVQTMALIRRTTGDMLDNYGLGISFYIADNAAVDNHIGQVLFRRQGADNSGRFLVKTVNAGVLPGNTAPGDFAVDPVGNVTLNADVFASGGQRVLALGAGTAPTSSPAATVQMWAADTGGAADKAGWHLRTEDGTSHVLGHLVGIGTLCTATLGSGLAYQPLNLRGTLLFVAQSSVQERGVCTMNPGWVVSTDATRQPLMRFFMYDATVGREVMRWASSGTAPQIGFLGAAAVGRQTINAAATDPATTMALVNTIRTALVNLGLAA